MIISIPTLLESVRPNLRLIKADQAQREMHENNGIMIDVRESNECIENPNPKAENIPRGILEMKLSQLYPDPETPIYIHCATGARASLSAEQLQRIGYTNVSVITCDLETIQRACN